MANQIIEVPDIAVVKTISGAKQLLSLRDQKLIKEKALVDIGAGSGIKYKGDLYVLKSEKIIVPESLSLLITATVNSPEVFFANMMTVDSVSPLYVDWGDGIVEKYTNGRRILHTYINEGVSHDIKMYGAINQITQICNNGGIGSIEVTNTKIEHFSFTGNNMTSLNCFNWSKLRSLYCQNNKLTSLDVRLCGDLYRIDCYGNQLTSLNIGNYGLENVSCYNNPLITNQSALIASANSLPNRTGRDAGRLQIQNTTSAAWIKDICDAKNWTIS